MLKSRLGDLGDTDRAIIASHMVYDADVFAACDDDEIEEETEVEVERFCGTETCEYDVEIPAGEESAVCPTCKREVFRTEA